MKFPEKKPIEMGQSTDKVVVALSNHNSIVVDTKYIGIWDIINLGHKGGIINLNGNYALRVVKNDAKWCNLFLIQYGKNAPKMDQGFTPTKIVKDDVKLNELREMVKNLNRTVANVSKENTELRAKLSNYQTTLNGSVSETEVHEI